MDSRLPQKVASSVSYPIPKDKLVEGQMNCSPGLDAHLYIKVHLSNHVQPRDYHRLVDTGTLRGSYRSPAASGIGEGTNAENTSYVLPLKMFAYNSTTHTPQEVSPSHLQKKSPECDWVHAISSPF